MFTYGGDIWFIYEIVKTLNPKQGKGIGANMEFCLSESIRVSLMCVQDIQIGKQ